MVVIFYLSHQPGDQLGSKLQWWKQLAEQVPLVPPDKLAHFYMYFVLGALAYLARPKPLTLPLIFCPLYGLSDEIHQLFIPYRQFDWFDLLADAIGSTTAILVVAIWGYSRSNSSDPQKSKATPQV
jgi:VanZ family protein